MRYSLSLLCLFILSYSAIADDAQNGRFKAQTCLGCHGVPSYGNVYPSYHVPKLAGQHAPYIVAALKAYQSGERSHPTMRAQAAGLTESDMQDIAKFFESEQSAVPPPTPPAASLSDELNSNLPVCAACHNLDGNSSLPENPRLAGQYRDYLYQSLLDYKEGKRNNPIMLGIVATLDEVDMKLLAAYFSKQDGLSTYHLDRSASVDSK